MALSLPTINKMFERQSILGSVGLYFYMHVGKDNLGGKECEIISIQTDHVEQLASRYKYCWIEPHWDTPYFSNKYKNQSARRSSGGFQKRNPADKPNYLLRENSPHHGVVDRTYSLTDSDAEDLRRSWVDLGHDVQLIALQT